MVNRKVGDYTKDDFTESQHETFRRVFEENGWSGLAALCALVLYDEADEEDDPSLRTAANDFGRLAL